MINTIKNRKPPNLWCVYHDGFAVYNDRSLTYCFRHIAKRMGLRTGNTTMRAAMLAGYEVRTV